MYDWIGAVLVAVVVAAGAATFSRRMRPAAARLFLAALGLRIFGGLARFQVLETFYAGVGDATGYFGRGWTVAKMIWTVSVPWTHAGFWYYRGKWWGTAMVDKVSGLVLAVIGPSIRGEFIAFSVLAFVGIYAATTAFRRVQPGQTLAYARIVWLWPSLWFWPSSVGKEAIIVLAMGLVTLGYVGRRGQPQWTLLGFGLALAFIIRPHVAAVLALALLAGYWLGTWDRATGRRLLEAAVAAVVAVAALYGMQAQFGLLDADLEGVREFVDEAQAQTLQGGSSIGTMPGGVLGLAFAFVNLWMRPFPWEAHNLTSLVSSLEIVALWVLVVLYRRHVFWAVRRWWTHPLLRFAVPLWLGYTLMIGLTFGNLGLIARQRAPLFLFLFMIVLAAPAVRAKAVRRPAEVRAPGGDRPRGERAAARVGAGPPGPRRPLSVAGGPTVRSSRGAG